MARPTTKEQLQKASHEGFDKLFRLLESLPKSALEASFPFEDRDRNVRDVLAHLHEWHLMMLSWYRLGMAGKKPKIPGEGYTWATIPALNQVIWEKWQSTGLIVVRSKLMKSHAELEAVISAHSDEELFTKKRYAWTGTTSLGAYLISATSSHYDWALKKLKRYQKALPSR